MDRKPEATGKKVYKQPRLKIYGDVLKLTGLVNNGGMATDAMFGASKTA
jgi:hypothetical protein